MDDFADIAKRMKELQLERDKPFDQPLQPDFHAELNAKLLGDKTAQANAKWRELREQYNQPKIVTVTPTVCKDGLGRSEQYKYNQAELEKLHGCW